MLGNRKTLKFRSTLCEELNLEEIQKPSRIHSNCVQKTWHSHKFYEQTYRSCKSVQSHKCNLRKMKLVDLSLDPRIEIRKYDSTQKSLLPLLKTIFPQHPVKLYEPIHTKFLLHFYGSSLTISWHQI